MVTELSDLLISVNIGFTIVQLSTCETLWFIKYIYLVDYEAGLQNLGVNIYSINPYWYKLSCTPCQTIQ